MRRLVRALGLLMVVSGLGLVAWSVTVWQWQDPFTALYTRYQQDRLAGELQERERAFVTTPAPSAAPARPAPRADAPSRAGAAAAARRQVAADARRYRRLLEDGDALGRLRVPRLGLDAVVVDGTASGDLEKGPGRYLDSGMPGEGRLVYIAGHRTTYGAPFAAIDELERGDRITLTLPYATFEYAVSRTRIVGADDLSVLRTRGREEIVLQACHPRFFASERYLAYGRLLRVRPRAGAAFTVRGGEAVAAARQATTLR
jgi:sortase A